MKWCSRSRNQHCYYLKILLFHGLLGPWSYFNHRTGFLRFLRTILHCFSLYFFFFSDTECQVTVYCFIDISWSTESNSTNEVAFCFFWSVPASLLQSFFVSACANYNLGVNLKKNIILSVIMNLCSFYCNKGCCYLQIVLFTLVLVPWSYLNQCLLAIQQFFNFCEIMTFLLVLYFCQNTQNTLSSRARWEFFRTLQ